MSSNQQRVKIFLDPDPSGQPATNLLNETFEPIKHLNTFCLIIVLMVCTLFAVAQTPVQVTVTNSTIAATDSVLPFWMTANRDGRIQHENSLMNLTGLSIIKPYAAQNEPLDYTLGVHALTSFGDGTHTQLNRLFAGMQFKGWELKGGMFYNEELYAGLSSSNGNIARSRNARPYPKLQLSTRGYKAVPFINNLFFKASFSEGLLNDNRFVDDVHLHHKSLYLMVPLATHWEAEGGLEHFVMWGGVSPLESIGAMPRGFKNYLRYVLGKQGGDAFPATDQLNRAGNSLGSYQFRLTRRFPQLIASFYLSHPFEDLSGMNWRNWPDNLLGIHLGFTNRTGFITDLVYEFTHTRQQSIRGRWDRQEPDSYFSHGVYQSGHTYHQRMMASPLFMPVRIVDGIARGPASNRLYAHHAGLRGNLMRHLSWRSMLTGVTHYGRYFSPYHPSQRQLSGLLELHYINPALPVRLGLTLAADATHVSGNTAGVGISIGRRF